MCDQCQHLGSEVIKTGVDPYGLRLWCWLRVGSVDKNQISHDLPTLRLKIN
jgi:hypothetical protein